MRERRHMNSVYNALCTTAYAFVEQLYSALSKYIMYHDTTQHSYDKLEQSLHQLQSTGKQYTHVYSTQTSHAVTIVSSINTTGW